VVGRPKEPATAAACPRHPADPPNDDKSAPTSLNAPPPPLYRYQRSANTGEEADALVLAWTHLLGAQAVASGARLLSLRARLKEVAEVRRTYEGLRDEQGFRFSTIP